MKISYIIFIFLLMSIGCSENRCKYFFEIDFIYQVEDEQDRLSICQTYDTYRDSFFHYKNNEPKYGVVKIKDMLSKQNVSNGAIDIFIDNWSTRAKQHRLNIQNRDSIHQAGVVCLKQVIANHAGGFTAFLGQHRKTVEKSLSQKQIKQIKKGIANYRKFNTSQNEDFYKEGRLIYGRLGDNIIAYNQLSFDIIDTFMTSEYSFGLDKKYADDLNEYYSNNPELTKLFQEYRVIEEKIVSDITTKACLKRIGVLRYYDALDEAQKERAAKANMLMNFFK